jgi:O-antigen ligase
VKFTVNNFILFGLGALILVPLNFFFLNTQIFYVQTLLIGSCILYLTASGKEKLGLINLRYASICTIFYMYVAWIVFSFVLNLLFSFDGLEIQGRRVVSFAMALMLLSSFLVGRHLYTNGDNLAFLVKGVCLTYTFVIGFYCYLFMTEAGSDLYVIRRVIGQRMPFIIAFSSTLVFAFFLKSKSSNIYYFVFFILASIIVILSLTRAAYIQIAISIFLLFFSQIKKYFLKSIIIIILLIFVVSIFFKTFKETESIKQISGRIELLFDYEAQSKKDISGSFRLEMWKFISSKLLNDPIRLVIGYGQLGPTHISKDFILSDGTSGTSSAHNQYLDIIVREGLIGLLLFLWLCYKSITIGLSFNNVLTSKGIFIFANTIGLVGVIFYSFFHETFRYPLFGFYFWLYLGILSRFIEGK